MNTLLRNARRYGTDEPVDILLSAGTVARIAPAGDIPVDGAEPVDLGGRFVGPGLWDSHVHFTQWVVQSLRFDLSPARSAAQALALTARELERTPVPPGETLMGYGFRDALWPDAPSRAALDAVAGDVPVVLVSGDLHCGWISSRAAARLGVATDDTGVLREGPWISALQDLSARKPPTDAYANAAAAAARRGVVGIVDFENADNAAEWPVRVADGVTSLRVEASVWPDRLDDAIAAGLRTGRPLDPAGLVTFGRLKVVVDGSLNTATALCWERYPGADPGSPHACGVSSYPPAELEGLLVKADAAGIAAAVHAIGDRANSEVVDVFGKLRAGRLRLAGTIEHAQLLTEADFARFAALGLVASVQPEHAMDDRDVADRLWAGRTGRAFAYGSLHRAGAVVRLGSDAPVAPLDPWFAIAAAVSRSRDDRDAWHPEQCLPPEVAVAGSARGRLHLSVGDPADVVVVDADPLRTDHAALRTMPVAGTLLGARWTWRAL